MPRMMKVSVLMRPLSAPSVPAQTLEITTMCRRRGTHIAAKWSKMRVPAPAGRDAMPRKSRGQRPLAAVGSAVRFGRVKFRGITIDDFHSTDLDDALWAEADGAGTTVWVTIAGAASLVTPGSDIDDAARRRVVTRYFAGGHSSMLPRALEEKLSLLPERKKDAVTVTLSFNAEGSYTGATITPGTFRSLAKLTHGDVTGILADKKHRLHDVVGRLAAISTRLLAARRQRGALILYDLTEGWVSTEEGAIKKLERAADAVGHILVQEMMIAANVAVAEYACAHSIPVLYRNHQAVGAGPDRAALVALLDQAVKSGEAVQWLEEVRRATGIAMHRAEYGATTLGHFGLNLPAYLHFTSPIRRYADLVVQRQILAHVQGAPLPYTAEQIAAIASHINATLAEHREAEHEHHKDRANSRAQVAMKDDRKLDALSGSDLERVLRVGIRSGEDCPETLASVIDRRLADSRMPVICQALLLCDLVAQGPRWTAARARVIERLTRRPDDALSILSMAKNIFPASPAALAESSVEDRGDGHPARFVARWKVGDVEAVQEGTRQSLARQRAAVNLLAVLSGAGVTPSWTSSAPGQGAAAAEGSAPPAPQAMPTPEGAPVRAADGRDPISVLGEHAQKGGRPAPSYSFTWNGESHAPICTCACTYNGATVSGQAVKKQDAKRIAARAQLARFGL